ncbi:MAG: AIR synthase related protein, partial [Spirochaetota bacterium]
MAEYTYLKAGVDIDKGDRFVDYIKNIKSKAISRDIGGFAGGIEIDAAKYSRPVVLSTTDGVGTKLIVARQLGKYDTIGIDLVAMCVNDLIVCNAAPMVFLDYIACGRFKEEVLHSVMRGIVAGCEEADCILSGGETAEMPDMYKEN